MDFPINRNTPTVMHIDLNSCFATCEQQANPLLRNRPVAVAAYDSPNGCIVSPSYEAKAQGVKVGMNVRDGRLLCPDLYVMTPDPSKYRFVNLKLRDIFQTYSPDVVPKSIDEAVIDFAHTPAMTRGLPTIGLEIKERLKSEIGVWMRCNVGIGTNRFLAKTAAGLHKPDGLDMITYENLEAVYASMKLTDICGIATRYEARLNTCGIYTPLQFFQTSSLDLQKRVFKSIVGHYWYQRLRGYEIDSVDFDRKSYGQMYSLPKYTDKAEELGPLLMKLCEKTGRRMRRAGFGAHGIHIALVYGDFSHWHKGKTVSTTLYATQDIYRKAQLLMGQQPEKKRVAKISISCFDLTPQPREQLRLFEDEDTKNWSASDAMDKINDRYGEFVITPALMMGMDELVVDRISFGGVKELEELYTGQRI
jgi:DNA polymerase-4